METTPNGLVVKKSAELGGKWTAVVPTFVSSQQDGEVWLNTFTVPKGDEKFFRLALDLE